MKNTPLYGLFLATRDKTADTLYFFQKGCGIKASGQRMLDLYAS